MNNDKTAAARLLKAFSALDLLDPDMGQARSRFGNPPDRFQEANFGAIVRIILGQQISRSVASALWSRLEQQNWTDAHNLSTCRYEDLQGLGLSRRKSEYIIDLACAEADGRLCLDELNRKPADEFSQTLIAYRGIGSWTVNNYRLFCLADIDAWPGNDLALMEALKRLKSLDKRPSHAEMDSYAEQWQPYRGAAALMLWHIYACLVRDARPMG